MDHDTPRPLPILYSFRRCPYAMRARLALAASQQQCTLREVLLRDKPAHMLALSPKGTVPVLQLSDGRVLDQSLDIALWALRINDPELWLAPQTATYADMLALIAHNDGPFKHHLDRYKYAIRYEEGTDPTYHRHEGSLFLSLLNERLGDHAQLFGDRASLADFAIFPFVRQFANTDRNWFDIQPLGNLQNWLERHVTSGLFSQVMKKERTWVPGNDADPGVLWPSQA